MPTYAYVCKDCAHAFDVQQSFSDDSLTTCPECGGTLRKQFGAVGVVFKGSGFYKTDSRDSGKKSTASAPASASKDSGSDTGSSSSSSSDSKSTSSSTSGDSAKSAASSSTTSASSSDGSAA